MTIRDLIQQKASSKEARDYIERGEELRQKKEDQDRRAARFNKAGIPNLDCRR